ncbi:MAG: type II toxin-antitoxin system VapC family toxin [Thermoplasmata archaeon]|nr:MAG: type II toxin-antitoxin system VapC family toxin [Thermoplasmata archaeon]
MAKLKVYLDTSVFSAYFDDRAKMRQEQTQDFWAKLNEYDKFASEVVIDELNAVSDDKFRENLILLTKDFEILQVNEESEALADKYIKRGIFPEKYREDAIHLALASVNSIDILVSWNFEHLVKRKTRLEANEANSLNGYKTIDIIAPPEL